jgi:serine protease Do
MVRTLLLLAAFALGLAGSSAAQNPTPQEVVARELAAVVSISVLRAPQHVIPPADVAAAQTTAAGSDGTGFTHVVGSGFIIDPSGIIVTNRHVIEGAVDILVTLHDNTLLRAKLLAQASQVDIALLKVTPASPLPSVGFGDSDAVQVADPVLAIGNPLGLSESVTQGIVSALNRDIRDTPFDDYIQTDAAINHGNSGGPLFNVHGEVIGMNTALIAPDGSTGSIGLGFAIPSNDIKYVTDALRSPGGMHPGTLDFRIQQVTPEIADALDMPKAQGVIVGGTKEGGAASKCGIRAGDIILRYGTMQVTDVRALARAIARTRPGSKINLLIWRNEEPRLIVATVEAMPGTAEPGEAQAQPVAPAADPGWSLAPAGNATTGVLIQHISPGSPAADAGMTTGDVIVQVQQEKVAKVDDVAQVIAQARLDQRHYVIVLVRNSGGLRWLSLSLQE